jgi:hypothetical protein
MKPDEPQFSMGVLIGWVIFYRDTAILMLVFINQVCHCQRDCTQIDTHVAE